MPLFINKSNWFVRFWRLAVSLIAAFSLLNIQPAAAFDNGPTQQGGDGPQIEQAVLDALTEDSQTDYIIVMADQANLEAAYQIEDWVERGQYVVDALKATARESQKDVLAVLDEQGAKYVSFFAGNEIYVYGGTRSSLNAVQALGDEVAEIRAPVTITVGGQSSLVTFQYAIAAGSADAALPQWAREGWRWRILYLRGLIDSELARNGGKMEGDTLRAAFNELTDIYHAADALPSVRPRVLP